MIDSITTVAIVAIVGMVVIIALVYNRKLIAADKQHGLSIGVGLEDIEEPSRRAASRKISAGMNRGRQ